MRKTKTYKVKLEFVREKDEVSLSIRPGRKLLFCHRGRDKKSQ